MEGGEKLDKLAEYGETNLALCGKNEREREEISKRIKKDKKVL